jgi:precorrin-3B synthase
MADCPGVAHLAAMADGGLARIRTPGGVLTADSARAIADAAYELGSGTIDLTNRANLQIRGLALDAGPALATRLASAGIAVDGPADRRRNILLDPLSGLDPAEIRDCRLLAAALDEAMSQAPWIGGLSPKFSFVLDGGGSSSVGAIASDVSAIADEDGFTIAIAGAAIHAKSASALDALVRIAEAAASIGPDARAADLSIEPLLEELAQAFGVRAAAPVVRRLSPSFGALPGAVVIPAPVGRLDVAMLRWLADAAEREGCGELVLAPWSAVVLPGVVPSAAADLLAASEAKGFTPVAVAERLTVAACAGAPSCERAREPAKALGAAILALAAQDRSLLPDRPTSLHLSACSKGCASSAVADLLLVGASESHGWDVRRNARPRSAGSPERRLEAPSPRDILALLG